MKKNHFNAFHLCEETLRRIESQGLSHPTAIQEKAIPLLMEGHDLIGISQTGSGKTLAFLIPLIEKLKDKEKRAQRPYALILAPTRELCLQINEEIKTFSDLSTSVLIGGVDRAAQVDSLSEGVHVVVATVGRLMDLLEKGDLDVREVDTLVLDEADMMLDMGFYDSVIKLYGLLPSKKQMILFSATMPSVVENLCDEILCDPKRVSIAAESSTVESIDQSVYFVALENKGYLLLSLLESLRPERGIIFCKAKYAVAEIVERLELSGYKVGEIHSNRSQKQRHDALEAFRRGEIQFLVATDLASRGLDIESVDLVVNFDMPEDATYYVHRIGRSGRAGEVGKAISLCAQKDLPLLRNVEKVIAKKIPVVRDQPFHEELKVASKAKSQSKKKRRRRR